eukprot:2168914-Rhodomonas_salina.1
MGKSWLGMTHSESKLHSTTQWNVHAQPLDLGFGRGWTGLSSPLLAAGRRKSQAGFLHRSQLTLTRVPVVADAL